jgi:hypothetical protein
MRLRHPTAPGNRLTEPAKEASMFSSIRRHPWRVVEVLAVTSVVSISLFALQALGVTGVPDKNLSSRVDKANGIDANTITCTTSASYVDMPEMIKTFTVEGPGNKKVVVMFQAEVDNSVGTPTLLVQLNVDDVVPSGLSFAVLSTELGTETHGMNFISDSLAPGSHEAKIRWRSSGGDEVCVDNRSLIVLFDGS